MHHPLTQLAIQVGLSRKYNCFSGQGTAVEGRTCSNCVRRKFGGPFCCNDGWPSGERNWRDRGAQCINWTDKGDATV